jgi:hypothetical protein
MAINLKKSGVNLIFFLDLQSQVFARNWRRSSLTMSQNLAAAVTSGGTTSVAQ